MSDEQKKLLSKALKGRGAGRKLSADHSRKISEAHKANGHKPNHEAITISAEKRTGVKQSRETIEKRIASYLATVARRKYANSGL